MYICTKSVFTITKITHFPETYIHTYIYPVQNSHYVSIYAMQQYNYTNRFHRFLSEMTSRLPLRRYFRYPTNIKSSSSYLKTFPTMYVPRRSDTKIRPIKFKYHSICRLQLRNCLSKTLQDLHFQILIIPQYFNVYVWLL
jgi:hypothetical protein